MISSNPVDYVRGQLAALAYVTPSSAREVHVLRLRTALDRAKMGHKLRYALNVINLMREAQNLGHGYWFPTPLRAVPVEKYSIIVGSIPTLELQRHFRGISPAGYARVGILPGAVDLPVQTLQAWTDLAVPNTQRWCAGLVTNAKASMGPTVPSERIQYLNLRNLNKRPGSNAVLWTNTIELTASVWDSVVLCREPIGINYFRYFFGQVKAGRLVAETAVPSESARVPFGFAALLGKPIVVSTMTTDGGLSFHIPIHLPRPERQLALALGECSVISTGRTYKVRGSEFTAVVASTLKNLGCEVRETSV